MKDCEAMQGTRHAVSRLNLRALPAPNREWAKADAALLNDDDAPSLQGILDGGKVGGQECELLLGTAS
jgi:hypothetical protein